MKIHPYYRRRTPAPQRYTLYNFNRIDLTFAHLPPYAEPDASGALQDLRAAANGLFDARAAAAVSASIGDPNSVRVTPRPATPTSGLFDPEALLESKIYFNAAPSVFVVTDKMLAAMAYQDYFPDAPQAAAIRAKVSEALRKAGPGWCGSYGPTIDNFGQQPDGFEGNYEFALMFLFPVIYGYFDEIPADVSERAITLLMARGRIHRANVDDAFTSGPTPNDWSRAGYAKLGVNVADIPETENHVLGIATARYLTNQLLYQRTLDGSYDNRRNGDPSDSRPTCLDQLLGLLRNYLRNDFAEYNAKPYQEETRHALLNLATYAYDAEVRLGARMVLDHAAAHFAVSSNDLRRLLPFRRRDEDPNNNQIPDKLGFMDVGLLDANGADPMAAHFGLLAGNLRAYEKQNCRAWGNGGPSRPWPWAITNNFNTELTLEACADYRLPPSIHDLLVNDLHRRFYQRLHRKPMLDEPGQQRNCDNMELYSGSPSYLISAGGKPAIWVIPGRFGHGYQRQNLGVAVPISFMPTGESAGIVPPGSQCGSVNDSKDLIQIMHFSEQPEDNHQGGTINYGVGPDFACGNTYHLPAWTGVPEDRDGTFFVNRRSTPSIPPGFYLAIIKSGQYIVLEAFDTWLHPEVSIEQFQQHVGRDNPHLNLLSAQENVYTTYFGNRIHFVSWQSSEIDNHVFGSKILNIEYAAGNSWDTLSDAGNNSDPFLSGSIMRSIADGVTEVRNPSLGTTLTLDWGNPQHLIRRGEDGRVEQAGLNSAGQHFEVWVDFDWTGQSEGDFYRPFKSLAAAVAAVADGGVIRIVPGTSRDRSPISRHGKSVQIVAPLAGVTIGAS